MKKQINPSIKAHVLRTGLILISLVAFQAGDLLPGNGDSDASDMHTHTRSVQII